MVDQWNFNDARVVERGELSHLALRTEGGLPLANIFMEIRITQSFEALGVPLIGDKEA